MPTNPSDNTEPKPIGRPLKFDDPNLLKQRIEDYFEWCELVEDTRVFQHGEIFEWTKEGKVETRCKECRGKIYDEYDLPTQGCILVSGKVKRAEPPTITGLAIWLDCDKETIKNYGEREAFSGPIKNAYLRVQKALELKLHDEDTPPAKVIFGLTNFDGWQNKHFTDSRHSGELGISTLIKLQESSSQDDGDSPA